LLGPYPSAALYMRRDMLDQIAVTWTGSNATQAGSVTMGPEDLDWLPSMRRFEYGGRTYSYDTAMGVGAAWVEEMGVENVLAHARHLTSYFQDSLKTIPGAKVHSSCPEQATGIAAVSLANMDGLELSKHLKERFRIIQRPALWGTTVRISLAAFIEERDVDYLLESLESLSQS
jgi:selenocysteine lyase/cysteine desulfurase